VDQLFPHWGKRERGILKSRNGEGGRLETESKKFFEEIGLRWEEDYPHPGLPPAGEGADA